jgi:hypothetical protein
MQQLLHARHIASSRDQQLRLAPAQRRRQRIDAPCPIDQIQSLAASALAEKEVRVANVIFVIVRRELQRAAVHLFRLDRIRRQSCALRPGWAECRVQLDRAIERPACLLRKLFRHRFGTEIHREQ